MPQFARPDADIGVPIQWTICPACVGPLFEQINEPVPNDTDFIITRPNPEGATYLAGLSDVTDPGVDTGHILRYRYGKDEPSDTRIIDLTVTLLQGATVIATFTHLNIPAAITQANQPLTAAQAALITDYTDLRLLFTANTSGTGSARRALVTWAELEVPDAQVTTSTTSTSTTTITTVTLTTTTTLPPPVGHPVITSLKAKVLDLTCTRKSQANGTIVVPETAFVDSLVDPATGALRSGVAVRITGLTPSSCVLPNRVVAFFQVTLEVTLAGVSVPSTTPLVLSIKVIERCPGAGIEPGETVVQLHDIQPLTNVAVTGSPGSFSLVFWVVVDSCLVVATERILKVDAAAKPCI